MVGYDVTIYRQDEHGEKHRLAGWSADGLGWIKELVRLGRATLVENAGGYPFRYEILASELLPLFSPTQRDHLGCVIERKVHTGDWNDEPYTWHGYIRAEEFSVCSNNAVLTVEAWDQS